MIRKDGDSREEDSVYKWKKYVESDRRTALSLQKELSLQDTG